MVRRIRKLMTFALILMFSPVPIGIAYRGRAYRGRSIHFQQMGSSKWGRSINMANMNAPTPISGSEREYERSDPI